VERRERKKVVGAGVWGGAERHERYRKKNKKKRCGTRMLKGIVPARKQRIVEGREKKTWGARAFRETTAEAPMTATIKREKKKHKPNKHPWVIRGERQNKTLKRKKKGGAEKGHEGQKNTQDHEGKRGRKKGLG